MCYLYCLFLFLYYSHKLSAAIIYFGTYITSGVFPGGTSGKEPACQCRRPKRCRFDPWVVRSPGGQHGNPLQYYCLEKPMGREAWQGMVHRITRSWTWLKQFSTAYITSDLASEILFKLVPTYFWHVFLILCFLEWVISI